MANVLHWMLASLGYRQGFTKRTHCRSRELMISSNSSLIGRPTLGLLLMTITAVGCVDLRKPEVIEQCAAAGNCSDDPSQHQKRDAKKDVEQPSLDSQEGDTTSPQPYDI